MCPKAVYPLVWILVWIKAKDLRDAESQADAEAIAMHLERQRLSEGRIATVIYTVIFYDSADR